MENILGLGFLSIKIRILNLSDRVRSITLVNNSNGNHQHATCKANLREHQNATYGKQA